ncbi:MAG: hypothetical protein SGI71_03040 [Verrucomicrobiota bacterium]|nr:hypothetical protein [Verrucomicrobiota bacterium]
MMNVIFIVAIYFALLLQVSVPPIGFLFGAKLDLICCLVIYTGMSYSLFSVFFVSIVGGVVQDALSNNSVYLSDSASAIVSVGTTQGHLGMSAFPYLFFGILLYSNKALFFRSPFLVQMLLGGGVTFLILLVNYTITCFAREVPLYYSLDVILRIFGVSLINMVLTPFVFSFMDSMSRRMGLEDHAQQH